MSKLIPATPIQAAQLDFDAQGRPHNHHYNDIYYAVEDGLQDSQYTYLHHNQLPQRWHDRPDPQQPFVICETGFGTGLNFLATWQAWQQAGKPCRLCYIGIDKHPLTQQQLSHANSNWPELTPLKQQLTAVYPELIPGLHNSWLDDDQVQLILLWSDIGSALPALHSKINAWFLDGFTPAKNPSMWQGRLFQQMARLSAPGASYATFTAASTVKAGLQQNGFNVMKAAGFGHKRDMLFGRFGRKVPLSHRRWDLPAHPGSERPHFTDATTNQPHIGIIGAGLAGSCCAWRLSRLGYKVTLIDQHPGPAQGTSAIPAGLLRPWLDNNHSLRARYYWAGFLSMKHAMQAMGIWQPCGVLELVETSKHLPEIWRQSKTVRALSGQQACQQAGVALPEQPHWYYPQATALQPTSIIQTLLDTDGIHTLWDTQIHTLNATADGSWQLQHQQANVHVDKLILATGSALNLLPTQLPTQPVRGQLRQFSANSTLAELKTAWCGAGYLSPELNGKQVYGSSYQAGDAGTDLRQQDDQQLAQRLHSHFPQAQGLNWQHSFAGARLSSRDRMPCVGPVPKADSIQKVIQRHQPLAQGYYPNLYCSIAHGSRGLTGSMVAADILAAHIGGHALPVETAVATAVHPARFAWRAHKQANQN